MEYRNRVSLLTLILCLEILWAAAAHAAAPLATTSGDTVRVLHNGVYSFDWNGSLTIGNGTWNFQDDAPPVGVCVTDATRTRMPSIVVGYSVRNTNPRITDALQFSSIFGRGGATAPHKPFPGVDGTGPVLAWSLAHRYYSGEFVAPVGKISGTLAFESNLSRGCRNTNGTPGPCGQPFYDVSISKTCNDYTSAVSVALHVPSDGQPHFRYTEGYLPGDLQPGQTYFLNIRLSDPNDHWGTSFLTWRGRVQ